jgi:hemimethylated DNA binding protein
MCTSACMLCMSAHRWAHAVRVSAAHVSAVRVSAVRGVRGARAVRAVRAVRVCVVRVLCVLCVLCVLYVLCQFPGSLDAQRESVPPRELVAAATAIILSVRRAATALAAFNAASSYREAARVAAAAAAAAASAPADGERTPLQQLVVSDEPSEMAQSAGRRLGPGRDMLSDLSKLLRRCEASTAGLVMDDAGGAAAAAAAAEAAAAEAAAAAAGESGAEDWMLDDEEEEEEEERDQAAADSTELTGAAGLVHGRGEGDDDAALIAGGYRAMKSLLKVGDYLTTNSSGAWPHRYRRCAHGRAACRNAVAPRLACHGLVASRASRRVAAMCVACIAAMCVAATCALCPLRRWPRARALRRRVLALPSWQSVRPRRGARASITTSGRCCATGTSCLVIELATSARADAGELTSRGRSSVHVPWSILRSSSKFGFRAVVFGWEPRPHLDVSHWDGVVGLPSGAEQPFYRMIPDNDDCVSLLGGARGVRYVAQENLEPLPAAQEAVATQRPNPRGWAPHRTPPSHPMGPHPLNPCGWARVAPQTDAAAAALPPWWR